MLRTNQYPRIPTFPSPQPPAAHKSVVQKHTRPSTLKSPKLRTRITFRMPFTNLNKNGESFTRWLRCECLRSKFLRPHHLWVLKVSTNSFVKAEFGQTHHLMVSPPLNLHSENDKVPFVGPWHLPKFWGKKPKATTKVTITSQSIAQIRHDYYKFHSLWLSRYIWICTGTQNVQNVSSRIRHLKWYLPQWLHYCHHSTLGHWSFPVASCNLSLVSWRWYHPL